MDLIHQLDALTYGPASGSPLIVMVQPIHDRKSHYLVACILRRRNRSEPFRYLLRNPLMGSCLVEVDHIRIEHALELLLLKDQQMIQAFLTNTSQEAFTDGIGSGSVNGGFEQLDATGPCHTSETRPKFGIVITNQVLGCVPIGGGFSSCCATQGSSDANVNHLARFQFDNKESEERSKEQVRHL